MSYKLSVWILNTWRTEGDRYVDGDKESQQHETDFPPLQRPTDQFLPTLATLESASTLSSSHTHTWSTADQKIYIYYIIIIIYYEEYFFVETTV